MSDNTGRPILPQGSYGSDNNFVPPEPTGQKNYVFVDEHNRQRRLKVMRACEACRRRKIKCDAVTTNKWPCQKCQRSGLDCVPPPSDGSGFEFETEPVRPDAPNGPNGNMLVSTLTGVPNPDPSYNYPRHSVAGLPTSDFHNLQDGFYYQHQASTHSSQSQQQPSAPMRTQSFDMQAMSGYHIGAPQPDQYSQSPENLRQTSEYRHGSIDTVTEPIRINRHTTPSDVDVSEAMGSLSINDVAVASYMNNQKQLAQTPAVEEDEVLLPIIHRSTSGSNTVSIPEEMMPSEEEAQRYFKFYFANIHPYVPVIIFSQFMRRWSLDKWSISPLILEGIFACATHGLGEKENCARWLALATRHQESFKDTPRLSTIQGLLILVKAREAAPQRGYFYRSWMNLVMLVAMAKDLEFHEHYDTHQNNSSCGSNPTECAIKTRIWHLLYQLEIMIGGPQGRTDFSVHTDTIDFEAPRSTYGLDDAELNIFRDQTQFVKAIRNVRESSRVYASMRKKKKDWAADPEFVANDKNFEAWLQGQPQHFQITYPDDGSPPYISFHTIANIHSYHWLGVVMHHRPQLQLATETSDFEGIQKQMRICYNAATKLCRLHEAINAEYGLMGLASMQRGVSFTIYTVLTSTMLHLTALTSPDPDINNGAANYFVRHMRLLEYCSEVWPMPEMKAQIDSLRQAFSADISKPFELKQNFPFGTPRKSPTPSTPSDGGSVPYDPSQYSSGQRSDLSSSMTAATTASTGTGYYNAGRNSSVGSETMYNSNTSDTMYNSNMTNDQSTSMPGFNHQDASQFQWNPGRLMSSWDAAFNPAPPPATSPQSVPQSSPPAPPGNFVPAGGQPRSYVNNPSNVDYTTYNATTVAATSGPNVYNAGVTPPSGHQIPQNVFVSPQSQSSATSQMYTHPTPPSNFFTPNMWQEAVASTFADGNLKRRYGDGPNPYANMSKKSNR